MTQFVKASEFEGKFVALVEEVARTGQGVVITKDGKPVADLLPHRQTAKNARGILKGELIITGDIMSPIDVEWDALK